MTLEVILLTFLVFFVIVSIHEWGHLFFAKKAGILVREFAIGFGPKIFSIKYGETKYTIRIFPIGGFVRMAGEDPETIDIKPGDQISILLKKNKVVFFYLDKSYDQNPNIIRGTVQSIDLTHKLVISLNSSDLSLDIDQNAKVITKTKEFQISPWNRQFGSKTLSQRTKVIIAGSVMNFVLSFILFNVNVLMVGVPDKVLIDTITPKSVAESVDLREGDVILSINNELILSDIQKVVSKVKQSAGKRMIWLIEREKTLIQKEIIPNSTGSTGISITAATRNASTGEIFTFGLTNMIDTSLQIFKGFKMILLGEVKLNDLGGPVQIFNVTKDYAIAGINKLVLWTAILSLYLGIFNLLPLPSLDGGRLMFIIYEAIRGKPINPNKESIIHFIGFAALMTLMILVTYNDIKQIISDY